MKTERSSVLIVDDSRTNIAIMKDILSEDHEVFSALTGKEALKIARQENVDLILLDVVMPEMDGYEVCKRLKADPDTKNIPVIFVTSMTDMGDETKGLELGAIDYMLKPVRAPIVKARVRNHLELKKYRDFLENLSMVDGLTGVWNRRHFDEVLDKEWRRAMRGTNLISVILLDVDFFKKYNDHYGHLAGDDCLRQVAKALEKTARRGGDMVARYGGEEFVIITAASSSEEAHALAEKLRISVEMLAIPHATAEISDYVTISLGVATVHPNPCMEVAGFLEKVDRALYLAKSGGRNRVAATCY
ncbi:MAG: diguanylate cyclase [Negativicutes bacterium]